MMIAMRHLCKSKQNPTKRICLYISLSLWRTERERLGDRKENERKPNNFGRNSLYISMSEAVCCFLILFLKRAKTLK